MQFILYFISHRRIMPTIEEVARELHDVFNISSGTSKECRTSVSGNVIIFEYFNAKTSSDEKKVLSIDEADALIQAIYQIYGAKRGQNLNPVAFKQGFV